VADNHDHAVTDDETAQFSHARTARASPCAVIPYWLMRAEGMVGAVARRRRPRTTIPGDESQRPRDLAERDFRAPAPNQLWVTDITYDRAGRWRVLLHRVRHRCVLPRDRWLAGFGHPKTELALDALDMALWARKERLSTALVHHGDRGVQYTSIRYGQRVDVLRGEKTQRCAV
jgi:transposase InsO family protein